MNTTIGQRLLKGTFWQSQKDNTWHVERRAEDDVEKKLLTGQIGEFGFLSAIREVLAVEQEDGFVATKAAYVAIVEVLEHFAADLKSTAKGCDTDFSAQYQVVAQLVTEHANTLL